MARGAATGEAMRKFTIIGNTRSMWVFGEGTINPEGDYYFEWRYVEPTGVSLASFEREGRARNSEVEEIVDDPDLEVAEGL